MFKIKGKAASFTALAMTVLSCAGITAVNAQEDPLIWSFSQQNNTSGSTASLVYGVPETDNVQVMASCGGDAPVNASKFLIGADIGNLQNATPAKVRFSGQGREYEIAGKVFVSESGEGISGVELIIPNSDPIWRAFDTNSSLGYQVPGYLGSQLPLVGGQNAISDFVEACRFIAGNSRGGGQAASKPTGSGITEADAFKFAKELDTADGYNAFLRAYPQGFFADLARGHLAKMQGGGQSGPVVQNPEQPPQPPVSPQPQPTSFSYLDLGPGTSRWFNSVYSQNEGSKGSYSANVITRGSEMVLYCTPDKAVSVVVRQNGSQYPNFDERVNQDIKQNGGLRFTFSGGGNYDQQMQLSGLTGEVSNKFPVAVTNGLVTSLIKDKRLTVRGNTFGASYQLGGSKAAICGMLSRCGAVAPACAPRRKATPPPRPPRVSAPNRNCRARSVYIEGRGCVLRSSLNPRPREPRPPLPPRNGCRPGEIRFDGQCMFRSEIRGYCGPGFVPRGNRCVSMAPEPRETMLRDNNGGTISLSACRARGMIQEGLYCVEND